jgi:hypothetical protein
MIPQHFVILKELPLLANGKLNRRDLPKPNEQLLAEHGRLIRDCHDSFVFDATNPELQKAPAIPLGTTDGKLRDMWAQLNIHVTSSDQNFWEVGGSSLIAMQFLYPIFVII